MSETLEIWRDAAVGETREALVRMGKPIALRIARASDEGRRARMGASMMAPDYTQWHGMFEVADRFYLELVPQACLVLGRVGGLHDLARRGGQATAELHRLGGPPARDCRRGHYSSGLYIGASRAKAALSGL